MTKTKTHADYLAELDDLLVKLSGQVLTTKDSFTIAILANFAVTASRDELLDGIGRRANVAVMDLRTDEEKRVTEMIDDRDLSACCTAPTDPDVLICGQCGEHCELLPQHGEE